MKYLVELTQLYVHSGSVVVKAKNREEAEAKAIAMAGDVEMKTSQLHDSDPVVVSVKKTGK